MIFNNFNELKQSLPAEGRLMAIDVGTKRIGIAICDKSRTIATPKTTIKNVSDTYNFGQIKDLVLENNIKAIIVGMPLNMDDSENPMTKFVSNFTANLDQFLKTEIGDFKICFFDERLTSFMVKNDIAQMITGKTSKKKDVIDQMAASLILQAALQG